MVMINSVIKHIGIKHPLLWGGLVGLFLLFSIPSLAQDSLWVKFDNRFKANKFLLDLTGVDSIELRAKGTVPVIRQFSENFEGGYKDYRTSGLVNNEDGPALVLGDPGRILWKPKTSDNDYNNDYTIDTNKWCFKHSKESEHFVVFWDKSFGDNPNASTVPSNLRVDIDDLLKKAEQFYDTNVNTLHMCVEGKSRLDTYKILIYLLYQSEWLATGSGSDNTIGTLWVNPSTCQPVGSTIGHEIGHSFQYQTYCDNIMNGKANDNHSGFRYGYPNSNGGCGFWEQCAQWQSYQDYPSQAIQNYHFAVWVANCHRHFEHEWQRYASYWLQYYWSEKNGMTALGRIWNESYYPEDASQAYMRIFCNNDYDTFKKQYFEYAQKTVTFDYDAVRSYVGTAYNDYSTKFYDAGDGWKQVAYAQCPQPTGFNVIDMNNSTAGTTLSFTLRALEAGSALASADPGKQVDGDGATVATVTNYNSTDIAGHEGLAFGFVALKWDGTREYGEMNIATPGTDVTATYTIPEKTRKVWVVVQGCPDKYFQCPWDEKESTDNQLPYLYK